MQQREREKNINKDDKCLSFYLKEQEINELKHKLSSGFMLLCPTKSYKDDANFITTDKEHFLHKLKSQYTGNHFFYEPEIEQYKPIYLVNIGNHFEPLIPVLNDLESQEFVYQSVPKQIAFTFKKV